MASNACIVLAIVLAALLNDHAGDPDLTSDYFVPNGVTPDANYFTFRGMNQSVWGAPKDTPLKVTRVGQDEFAALTGQSVSLASVQYAANSINRPHVHPRAAELLIILQGWLEVGFVDTNNKLYTQVLQRGDMFVFPKGLVHFQVNKDPNYPAVSLSAFGSANPGIVLLPKTLFGSGIDKDVLAKFFQTNVQTIEMHVLAATSS